MAERLNVTPEELYMLIGEREVIKYKQGEQIKVLYAQIDEMSQEITRLRRELENGKLEQSDNNDAV